MTDAEYSELDEVFRNISAQVWGLNLSLEKKKLFFFFFLMLLFFDGGWRKIEPDGSYEEAEAWVQTLQMGEVIQLFWDQFREQ